MSFSPEENIAGNHYDKYNSKNPITRLMVDNFRHSLDYLVTQTKAKRIHEIGCGEGYLSIPWAERDISVQASDISPEIIHVAKGRAIQNKVTIDFKTASIYDLCPERDSADLIVCCEVLEHLPDPEKALSIISRLSRSHVILSVPREPIWSILNILRGKYWARGGNTPGHIQRWSTASFVKLVSREFYVDRLLTPLPWTMLLCRPRRHLHSLNK